MEGNQVSWRYIFESTYGVTPGTPTLKEILRAGGGLQGLTDTIRSNNVRTDAMRQGIIRVGQHAEGGPEVELAYGQYDDLLEAMLRGTFSAAVAISATNIDASTTDDSLNRAAGSFITDGVQAGMWVLVAGFSNAPNNGLFRVNAVTALKLTFTARVDLTTGLYGANPNLTTEAAGPTVTVRNAGMLRNGTVKRSMTWERGHLDGSRFFQFRGMRLGQIGLNIAAKSIITATLQMMGKSFTKTSATIASSVTPPNSNDVFNSVDHVLGMAENNADFPEIVTGITFNLNNQLRALEAVRELTPPDVRYGTQDGDGELSIYASAAAIDGVVDRYMNFSTASHSFVLRNGASPVYYVLTLPAYKYSGGLPEDVGLDADVPIRLPFQIFRHTDGYQVQLDRISTT